jgi:hypothetical protein
MEVELINSEVNAIGKVTLEVCRIFYKIFADKNYKISENPTLFWKKSGRHF